MLFKRMHVHCSLFTVTALELFPSEKILLRWKTFIAKTLLFLILTVSFLA